MATKLGTVGVLDILLAGDTALLKKATKEGTSDLERFGIVAGHAAGAAAKFTAAAGAAAAAVFAWTQRVSESGDQFSKMSVKVGASVEFLSAFAHAANLGGVSTEAMEKSLGRMTRTMSDASNGLATAQRSFDQLGIKVQNTDGTLREVPEVLLQVADRIAGMKDQTKQAALAQEIFGKSGLDLLPVLKQGSAAIREQMEEARRLGIVWSTEAAVAAEEFNDNVDRLKRSVDGLQIQMAGPFIKAFNDAAKAMLDAQRRGEGFFRVMSEGIFRLTMGSDLQMLDKKISDAADALLRAQNKLDQARNVQRAPGMSGFGGRMVKQAEAEVAAAEAELKKLQAIRNDPFASPAIPAAPKTGPAPGSTPTVDTAAVEAARKQAEDEHKARAEAAMAAWEEEQEMSNTIADARREVADLELEERRAREQADIEARIKYYEQVEQYEYEHGQELLKIGDENLSAIEKFERMSYKDRAKTIFGFLSDITAGTASHNRQMFELNKAAGIATAIVNAYEGISRTLGAYPYPFNIAMAAAHGLAAFAQVNAIRSQSFGGGGGAAPSIAGSTPATPVSPVSSGQPGGAAGARSETMTVQGISPDALFSGDFVRGLADKLLDFQRNGGKVVFAQ